MTTIIGVNFLGENVFDTPTTEVTDMTSVKISGGIFDQMEIRSGTDNSPPTLGGTTWTDNTIMAANFNGDLSAGNLDNKGVPVSKFVIKRRKAGDTAGFEIGRMDYAGLGHYQFIDHTQPSGDVVYSLVPVSASGIEGVPNDVAFRSKFVGWWIIDRDDKDKFIAFDQIMNDINQNVDVNFTQGKTVINTLSKFPQIYYTDSQYHTFTLSTVIVPKTFSFEAYSKILDTLGKHKPLIVKSGSGDIFVCDVSVQKKASMLNAYDGNDHFTITVECTEVDDYGQFLKWR